MNSWIWQNEKSSLGRVGSGEDRRRGSRDHIDTSWGDLLLKEQELEQELRENVGSRKGACLLLMEDVSVLTGNVPVKKGEETVKEREFIVNYWVATNWAKKKSTFRRKTLDIGNMLFSLLLDLNANVWYFLNCIRANLRYIMVTIAICVLHFKKTFPESGERSELKIKLCTSKSVLTSSPKK